jgi:hypothetical protein
MVKVKLSLQLAGEAHRVVRCRGFLGSQMAVRLSALHAGRPPFAPHEGFQYSFLLEAESTREPQYGWKDYVN